MKVILSTRNPSKAAQISGLFEGSLIELITLDEANIEGEAVEDGTTLGENALKKAQFARERSDGKTWTMADDTGLFIAALGGKPGIHAARWAGETASTEEIMKHTLRALEGAEDRSASFVTTVALVSPDGMHHFFTGEIRGVLLAEPRCEPQPKMPHSPIFLPNGTAQVWAEMSVEDENEISHRGIAFRQARAYLESAMH